jgi:trans-aconitate methyltransferase
LHGKLTLNVLAAVLSCAFGISWIQAIAKGADAAAAVGADDRGGTPSRKEKYVMFSQEIPLPTHSRDIVFSACVFQHIPHEEHQNWLTELRPITRPGGLLRAQPP